MDKHTVEVRSKAVPAPVAVRYAWAANPASANLVNSKGLPTSVFRTDDWLGEGDEAISIAARKLSRALSDEISKLESDKVSLRRGGREYREIEQKQMKLRYRLRALRNN